MSTIPGSTVALLCRSHGVATRRQRLEGDLPKSSIETRYRSGAPIEVCRMPIAELAEQTRRTALCLTRSDPAVNAPWIVPY